MTKPLWGVMFGRGIMRGIWESKRDADAWASNQATATGLPRRDYKAVRIVRTIRPAQITDSRGRKK